MTPDEASYPGSVQPGCDWMLTPSLSPAGYFGSEGEKDGHQTTMDTETDISTVYAFEHRDDLIDREQILLSDEREN